MKVSSGVAMLELEIQETVLNPTLVWDENSAVLIDTGMPGQSEQILEKMTENGVSLDQLKAVILTHQDLDHIGSLPELLERADHPIEVYAHEADQPYIEGTRRLMKADPENMNEEVWNKLPDQVKELYKNPPKAEVTKVLKDGDELPEFGGMKVISTPGHTPGHISLLLKEGKTLVVGDAMVCSNEFLQRPVDQVTPDMDTALQSMRKLLDYDIDQVICFHGGLASGNIHNQIKRLTEE